MKPSEDSFWADALRRLERGDFSRSKPFFDKRSSAEGHECQIVEWFEKGYFDNEPKGLVEAFSCACFLGRTEVAMFLLDKGVDPASGIGTGLTGFHWAANRGNLDTLQMLIDRKAPLEQWNMYGGTVLGCAVFSAIKEPRADHLAIIEALVTAGANVESTDYPTGDQRIDKILGRRHDPITRDQRETLLRMLEGLLTEKALEGFLIVCSRLVDEFGNHRTDELSNIFRTHKLEGRLALVKSLEYMNDWVGGMEAYKRLYPVTVDPPNPAFPQLKIIGIEMIEPYLYRVMDSKAVVYGQEELVKDYIQRTGRLPPAPVHTDPVLRSKPLYHWCSYEKWDTPETTRHSLQILPKWSDCRLRATIRTADVAGSAFMAFNGDKEDPSDSKLRFYKYFFEPLAQDHPAMVGGGSQIGLDGEPPVEVLEEWDDSSRAWNAI